MSSSSAPAARRVDGFAAADFARLHAAFPLEQQPQELEFGRGQFDGLALRGHFVAFDVEQQRARGEARRRLRRGGLGATQQRLGPEHQFAHVERLRDVVVGAALQPLDLVGGLRLRREEDDRGVLEQRIRPHHAQQLHAGEFGHHDVEDDQVGAEVAGQPDRPQGVVERADGVAGLAEFVIEQLGHVRFIVDDEDALEMFGVHKGEPHSKAKAG